jgi:hypothetical protein
MDRESSTPEPTTTSALSATERSGTLRYEHVHRIEITLTLLSGLVGRVRKQVSSSDGLALRHSAPVVAHDRALGPVDHVFPT